MRAAPAPAPGKAQSSGQPHNQGGGWLGNGGDIVQVQLRGCRVHREAAKVRLRRGGKRAGVEHELAGVKAVGRVGIKTGKRSDGKVVALEAIEDQRGQRGNLDGKAAGAGCGDGEQLHGDVVPAGSRGTGRVIELPDIAAAGGKRGGVAAAAQGQSGGGGTRAGCDGSIDRRAAVDRSTSRQRAPGSDVDGAARGG